MVSVSLLQRLEGDNLHVAGTSQTENESAVMDSILASLRVLLNSRQGCCEIRPDYGLMDFDATAGSYRNAIALIARDVEQQIRHVRAAAAQRQRAHRSRTRRGRWSSFSMSAASSPIADRTVRVTFDSVLGSDGHMRFTR